MMNQEPFLMKMTNLLNPRLYMLLVASLFFDSAIEAAPAASGTVESLSFQGQADTNQASFVLTGRIKGTQPGETELPLIYTVQSQARVQIEPKSVTQTCDLKARVFQGKFKELALALSGDGEVAQVTGENLRDWSIRVGAKGERALVIRPIEPGTNAPPLTNLAVSITVTQALRALPAALTPLTFSPENAMFFDGQLEVKPAEAVELAITKFTGLAPLRAEPLIKTTNEPPATPQEQPLHFRFANEPYALALQVREKDPNARKVTFEKFQLTGQLKDDLATFVLTGEAVVKHPDGGLLPVLWGDAALIGYPTNAEVRFSNGRYLLAFRKPGTYPVELKFNARVAVQDGWNTINFEAVSSALRPVTLKGLSADTQFQFPGAAKPERQGEQFLSFLPSAGKLALQWKEAKTEEVGRLFFSAQGAVQIAVGPGLLREAHLLEFKVMQGELNQLVFDLSGEGEVSRIVGENILGWKVETMPDAKRRLVVQLNQARKDRYRLAVQTQTPLKAFPLSVQPLRLTPAQAIRFGGHLLVVNDGAVRLEVTGARGLSQISPELFPQSKELAELAAAQRSQAFAYRFSGIDFALTIQADNILPELSVSEMLLYHLGETETFIEAELELDIREAPLREFTVRVPADFTVSRLSVAQLSDYSTTPDTEAGWSKLKMLFATPLTGRQVAQLRLEKNQNAAAGAWTLPVLAPQNVKSVRGYVGVSAETGFRVTPGKLTGLTAIDNAYFPRKVAGLQVAYRLREEAWQAAMNVERLALSIQADATHLFTVNEGIAHGSTVIHYLISGAPVSTLRVTVPAEYSNLEFAGREVRSWKTNATGYDVYLQTPVFGTYTLLATYDRQFSGPSNTVSFAGVRPVDAQNEQGSVLVVSEQQIQVKPVEVSPGLLQLDPGEIPPETRLLFDAPILAAYQYTARPFTLQLALTSLALGQTVHQVVDRAALQTRVSREGEVVTVARYFLKSQGHSHLRLTVPKDAQLWEAKVNNAKVVPVADKDDTLIPLPVKADPGAILSVELKLASKSAEKTSVGLAAPALATPVMLTEWNVNPDEKYRLEFRGGTVAPKERAHRSGFAWLWRVVHGNYDDDWQVPLYAAPVLLLIGVLLLRWATGAGVFRWSATHLLGTVLGALACLLALACLVALILIAAAHPIGAVAGLSFTAPIQEPRQALTLLVENTEIEKLGFPLGAAWPAFFGLALWAYLAVKVETGVARRAGVMLGWTLLCWAALRVPNGAPAFFGLVILFAIIHLIIPSLRCQARVPRKPAKPEEPAPITPPAAGPATALLVGGLLFLTGVLCSQAALPDEPKSTVQSVLQQAKVVENFATVQATLTWQTTEAGQKLDFLSAPAVLTKIDYPTAALLLSEARTNELALQRLTAKEAGRFEIRFTYQVAIQKEPESSSFVLPTPAALVNRLELEIEKAEVDVFSAGAVSVQTTRGKRQAVDFTRAELVLAPTARATIAWRPRARDTKSEKVVFFGELYHLFIPTAGVIEGVHEIQVRLAQGQLAEVALQIPPALTITDVQADFVSSWRFDPDQRLLRVQFSTAQVRPFALRLRSQLATSPLPYQQTNGVITLVQAEKQVGMVGVATGSEVQLDAVKEEKLSTINLDDFPAALLADLAKQIPGLTLRRAFSGAEAGSLLVLSAAAVQPDVQVETQETLSLGEDRTVLASQLLVHITKAGIFKLSFALPTDFEVEALTGPALSHWTELKTGPERIITLHLRGKTEGDQQFSVALAGPGLGNRKEWEAPRLTLREASKQTGQLVLVPELGVRLHVKTPEGVFPLDPKKVGVTQKGVLAFRLLKPAWQLRFDIETVEPWIQLAWLQDVTVREGQVLVTAQLDYQIENAGVKSFPLLIPARAENVRFEGDLISDSVRTAGTNQLADWEIKLQRRVIGNYPLRLTYTLAVTNQPTDLRIAGLRARNVNGQRGYLAVRAGGRLQLQFPQLPPALQRAEWQSIPTTLRRGRDLAESKDTFSVLEPGFDLPLTLSRHEVAKVLPARVEAVELTSVVALSGEMLTEGRLFLRPGDKRLLRLKLPQGGEFWYAFVNGQAAWPWREGEQILLLLEKNSDPAKPTTIEFFYTTQTAARGLGGFNHQLLGPSFDLPLENITWQVYVPENWKVKDWDSSLQLRSETIAVPAASVNLEGYLRVETARGQAKSKEAESLFIMGNEFLQKGTPQQARRAYQSAWRLSPQDAALNEDARVQLHNLKMQQALLGLNQRRQGAFEYLDKSAGKAPKSPFTRWVPGQAPDYTQQQVQQLLEQNAAEENTALARVAERMIRQQDAGVGQPESIRAALPAQGKRLIFTGSLQVKEWADLRIKLDSKPTGPSRWAGRFGALVLVFAGLVLFAALTRKPEAKN
jgi:hypothetical protein